MTTSNGVNVTASRPVATSAQPIEGCERITDSCAETTLRRTPLPVSDTQVRAGSGHHEPTNRKARK